MLKKSITYEDLNGEEVTEDFYFHISKAELIELEMSQDGGFSEWLTNVVAAEDGKTIISEFKNIILSAYGVRSEDGRRFIKSQELRDEFEQTEAYSALFVDLVTNTDSAIEFVNGVIPKGLAEEVAKLNLSNPSTDDQEKGKEIPESTDADNPTTIIKSPIRLTRAEVENMPKEEFDKLGERITSGEVEVVDS